MRAEVPTSAPDDRRSRPTFLNSNRRQLILFAVLTLLLSLATAWGGRIWLRNSETLILVGETNWPEARFADTFKLGYEFVRDEIGMRREGPKRQSGREDVVIVMTAQSA